MFTTTLMSGVMITASSNSWLGVWMGLEINLLSFIPITSSNNNIFTNESSLKYFLIQALASSIFLFTIMLMMMSEDFTYMDNSTSMILSTPILMKSGAAPFHWWFPSVMDGLEWLNCFILITIQKIAPLILISYMIWDDFFITIIIMSNIVGSIGGYNQTSIRSIMTYSSINHIGWMMVAMMLSENLWLLYFIIYSTLTLSIILIIKPFQASFINLTFTLHNDMPVKKFMLFTSFLSLGGLPPFLGFLPKWMVITMTVKSNLTLLITVMVISSLITLYYYLRVSYSSFIILHSEPWWSCKTNKSKMMLTIMLSSISMLGLMTVTLLNSAY
uniref:NADH-ubiquinone oxidoreductase chain 2 n=1 Tax=Ischnoptera deropeltiformis TaxID=1585295 RepID=A0A2P1H8F5_9NEOP|nr:NADH dehydrogenase subunit 2 [Ischnoptera deropeltiformis]